jgi:hypothetical protein
VLTAAGGLKGELKKRAVHSILKTRLVMLQIGAVLAAELSKSDVLSWGGIRFIGFRSKYIDSNSIAARLDVITKLPVAILKKTSDEIAGRKLGEVFKVLAGDGVCDLFLYTQIFACVVASKPSGWHDVAEKMIERTDKNAFYLYTMLQFLLLDYRQGINITQDRDSLGRLIAQIQTKRSSGKNAPSAKSVTRMLRHLEETNQLAPVLGLPTKN